MAFYDMSGAKLTVEDLERVPVELPSVKDSMKQELSARGPWDKFTAGLGVPMSNFLTNPPPGPITATRRMLAGKPATKELTPQDQERLDLNREIEHTGMGRAGSFAGNVAMSYPLFKGVNTAANTMPTAATRLIANIAGSGGAGALYGAATNPDNRTEGATIGGLGGILGASFGELAQGPLRPGFGSSAEALAQQGVRMTPGRSGGQPFSTAEDAVRTFNPSVVDRQNEMIGDWNKLELARVLKEGGAQPLPPNVKAGWEANEAAGKSFGVEYQKAGSLPIQGDAQFLSDVRAIDKSSIPATDMPALRAQISAAQKTLANPSGTTGAIRQLETDLGGLAIKAKDSNSSALAKGYKELKNSLEALRARAGDSTPDLDRAYAQFARMRDAASGAASKDTGLFTPNQVVKESMNNASDAQIAYGHALLQKQYAPLGPVLGDTIPRVGPGTFEKYATLGGGNAALYALLSGNPGVAATGLGLYGANKLAYTPGGVSFLTGAQPWQSAYGPTIGALAPAATAQFLKKR